MDGCGSIVPLRFITVRIIICDHHRPDVASRVGAQYSPPTLIAPRGSLLAAPAQESALSSECRQLTALFQIVLFRHGRTLT